MVPKLSSREKASGYFQLRGQSMPDLHKQVNNLLRGAYFKIRTTIQWVGETTICLKLERELLK